MKFMAKFYNKIAFFKVNKYVIYHKANILTIKNHPIKNRQNILPI